MDESVGRRGLVIVARARRREHSPASHTAQTDGGLVIHHLYDEWTLAPALAGAGAGAGAGGRGCEGGFDSFAIGAEHAQQKARHA